MRLRKRLCSRTRGGSLITYDHYVASKQQKGDPGGPPFFIAEAELQELNVLRLPAFGSLDDVKLHCLAFL